MTIFELSTKAEEQALQLERTLAVLFAVANALECNDDVLINSADHIRRLVHVAINLTHDIQPELTTLSDELYALRREQKKIGAA